VQVFLVSVCRSAFGRASIILLYLPVIHAVHTQYSPPMKLLVLMAFALVAFSSCKNEGCTNSYALNYDSEAEEEDCSCIAPIDELEGTYALVLTSYPSVSILEGSDFDALLFRDHGGCNSTDDSDFERIKFNNLFTFFGCDRFVMTDRTFEITLDDNILYRYEAVVGIGTFIGTNFRFEGVVHTPDGASPIVIEGSRSSIERRTGSC
jgi:hypothetical protein